MTTLITEPGTFADDDLELSAASFHHLFRVRRLRRGDVLRVVDGEGRARRGEVARIDRHSARLVLGERLPSNEASLSVELLVAAPRPQRAAWLVEKSTEVGVTAVRFLRSKRAPRTYGTSTVQRLIRSARAAVEQCERSRVPAITAGHEWEDIEELLAPLDTALVLDPAGEVGAVGWEAAAGAAPDAAVGLLVGPEGGWDPSEVDTFESLGLRLVGLGPRILRVETAALVAAARLLVTSSVDTF